MSDFSDKLFVNFQKLLPQHLLSNIAFTISCSKNKYLKNFLIDSFIKYYKVDLSNAIKKSIDDYKSFHDFFIREIDLTERKIPVDSNQLASPAEGTISQISKINGNSIVQAKEHNYCLTTLLGGSISLAEKFQNGNFSTLYLAPSDYHRIHMPIDGTLKKMIFIPGKLFSVNKVTSESIPNLYANNERVVLIFDTEIGEIALVLVGSMIVGSIYTDWAGTIKSDTGSISEWNYSEKNHKINYKKGEEIAYFHLGSTVIILTQKNTNNWLPHLDANSKIKVREPISEIIKRLDS